MILSASRRTALFTVIFTNTGKCRKIELTGNCKYYFNIYNRFPMHKIATTTSVLAVNEYLIII